MTSLSRLFTDVKLLMDTDSADADPPTPPVPQLFGWRYPAEKKTSTHRIVWVPGSDTGEAGTLTGAKNPGGNPRSLATIVELFHCFIEASDPTQPENEAAQYEATRELYDAWLRAVMLSQRGAARVTFAPSAWVTDKNLRRRGAAIRVSCAIASAVHDLPHVVAPVDTSADIEVEELDHSEQMQAAPTDVE